MRLGNVYLKPRQGVAAGFKEAGPPREQLDMEFMMSPPGESQGGSADDG